MAFENSLKTYPNVLRKIQECWVKNEIDNPNNGWRYNSPNSGMDLNKYDIKRCLKNWIL